MPVPIPTIAPDYHHLYAEDRAYAKDGGTANAPLVFTDTGKENGVVSEGKTKPITAPDNGGA